MMVAFLFIDNGACHSSLFSPNNNQIKSTSINNQILIALIYPKKNIYIDFLLIIWGNIIRLSNIKLSNLSYR